MLPEGCVMDHGVLSTIACAFIALRFQRIINFFTCATIPNVCQGEVLNYYFMNTITHIMRCFFCTEGLVIKQNKK